LEWLSSFDWILFFAKLVARGKKESYGNFERWMRSVRDKI